MSNTDLPRIPASNGAQSLLCTGHWALLIGAILTIASVIGLSATSRPTTAHAPRGELAARPSEAP
jgi:hypothetical protein